MFRNILILHWHDVRHEFYNCNLCTQRSIEIRKFHSYRSRTYYYHRFRLFWKGKRLSVSYHFLAILRKIRKLTRTSPCRQNNMLCCIFCNCSIFLHSYFLTWFYFGCPEDNIYFVLFHQELHAFAHFFGYTAASLDYIRKVKTCLYFI